MSPFGLRDGVLHVEDVALPAIAERFGTPCYVYSRAAIEHNFTAYRSALAGHDHLVCYALKANSNLAVLALLAGLGSGFDIVSGGELARVLAAGGDPGKVVFSGVGKTSAEISAALDARILCFNVESAAELAVLDRLAIERGVRAPVSFRVNPDVDPGTHPYIATGLSESKFGIPFADATDLYREASARDGIAVHGIDLHIGSQITALAPFEEAIGKALELVDRLRGEGIALRHVDIGGGLGIRYRDETPIAMHEFAAAVERMFRGRKERILVEPGRRIVGDAGLLLTRVLYLKPGSPRSFAVVDAAMNDLLRPALYGAWHPIDPVSPHDGEARVWHVVGPVCESGDFLGQDRSLALHEGDLLAVGKAGAYGFVMSSNYNTRPRAAEVMVSGDRAREVRARETVEQLLQGESLLAGM